MSVVSWAPPGPDEYLPLTSNLYNVISVPGAFAVASILAFLASSRSPENSGRNRPGIVTRRCITPNGIDSGTSRDFGISRRSAPWRRVRPESSCAARTVRCGKTTCLRIVPSRVARSGQRAFDGGRCVTRNFGESRVGFVFPALRALPHMTVFETSRWRRVRPRATPTSSADSREGHNLLNLDSFDPWATGTRPALRRAAAQRVALARALAVYPKVLLRDSRSAPSRPVRQDLRRGCADFTKIT